MNEKQTYDKIKPILKELRDYLILNHLKHDFKCTFVDVRCEYRNFWEYKFFVISPSEEQINDIFEYTNQIENIINEGDNRLEFSGIYFYADNAIMEVKYAYWYDSDESDYWYDYDHNFY